MRRPPVGQESWKHKNVFETYLLMGPARNLRALSEATNISHGTLVCWNKSFKWEDRLKIRDNKVMTAIEQENDKLLKEVIKKRHQDAYKKVQEKALKFIENHGDRFKDGRDAAVALDIGIAGERKVLGLVDTKIKGALVKEGLAALVEIAMSA